MRRTASDRVGVLARLCTDPQEAEHRMREAIKWGLQVNKRTVRMIKLERLWKCGVGTGKVEMLGLRLAKEARGGRRGPAEERELSRTTKKKVMMLMNDKKLDAGEDLKLARVQFHKSKKELWKEVPWMSRAGAGVREVLRVEMAMEWEEKRRLMARSVKYLVDKFRRGWRRYLTHGEGSRSAMLPLERASSFHHHF